MIRTVWRAKGVAVLGASQPGETGPFGPYGGGDWPEGEEPAEDEEAAA